jgi:mannose/cellobiose epimerase-like protein (N-acyl-D-glucosamine 2-epimerase family)
VGGIHKLKNALQIKAFPFKSEVMSFGPHTILEQLAQKLLIRWMPKWHEVFRDEETGGGAGAFHERLTRGFKPIKLDTRRLLTQCRQLAVYSHASLQKEDTLGFKPDLKRHFEVIKKLYFVPETEGWRFSVTDAGSPKDDTYDLYTMSFVIFAFCHYYRATKDEEAHVLAIKTLKFIHEKFRMPGLPGFAEALDKDLKPVPAIRRQNPHMHLLEACLFAAEIWDDELFIKTGDEMVSLFLNHFFDTEKMALYEWFTDDLKPHPEKGHIVEPGHYYEWIWLLKKHAEQQGDKHFYNKLCFIMLDWANTHGWDNEFGGIYDEVGIDGTVISETKRIWPYTEALKANALMLIKDRPDNNKARKERIARMVDIFKNKYIDQRGFWTERLNRDLTPLTDYMPGTTPYHVYFGIMETRDILRSRGKGKSFVPVVYGFFYRLRRRASNCIRSFKLWINR